MVYNFGGICICLKLTGSLLRLIEHHYFGSLGPNSVAPPPGPSVGPLSGGPPDPEGGLFGGFPHPEGGSFGWSPDPDGGPPPGNPPEPDPPPPQRKPCTPGPGFKFHWLPLPCGFWTCPWLAHVEVPHRLFTGGGPPFSGVPNLSSESILRLVISVPLGLN